MRLTSEHTLTLSDPERTGIAEALYEALSELFTPRADGYPFNWRSDPGALVELYEKTKPAEWGSLRVPGRAP